MKQLIFIIILLPFTSFGQTISSSQLGVNSQTNFTTAGQPVGAFMSIFPNDTSATFGFTTNAGYTYQLAAPFITGNYTGTAVCQEYVDSSILSIPSLHIGAPVPGGIPNTVLFANSKDGLFVDPAFQYYKWKGLVVNSPLGVSSNTMIYTNDGNDDPVAGIYGGKNGVVSTSSSDGNTSITLLTTNDGTYSVLSFAGKSGEVDITQDPNTGGASFDNNIISTADFQALDGSSNVTSLMGDGYITTQNPGQNYGAFIETTFDGSTNVIGIYNPLGTVLLQQSTNGITWNLNLPTYATEATAAANGLTKGDLYQDLTGVIHIKQ